LRQFDPAETVALLARLRRQLELLGRNDAAHAPRGLSSTLPVRNRTGLAARVRRPRRVLLPRRGDHGRLRPERWLAVPAPPTLPPRASSVLRSRPAPHGPISRSLLSTAVRASDASDPEPSALLRQRCLHPLPHRLQIHDPERARRHVRGCARPDRNRG